MDKNQKILLIISAVGVIVGHVVALKPALLLTPYLQQGRAEEARNLSRVDSKLFLDITSYSGFFTVDKKYDSNVFFWYFPVANKSLTDTPWIIWLQGGPGASSLVGLFDEMGPFEYDDGLKFRKTSWWHEYSMVFIDNPVGAGFSFTNHLDGLPRDMETYANHLYSTVQQFMRVFPELRGVPLYIAGSSYAGRYVPALASKISAADAGDFNLKGLILGNPVFNRESIMDYSTVFYQWGIIDQQGVQAVRPLQNKYKAAIRDGYSELAAELRNELLDKLQDLSYQYEIYNILSDDDRKLREFMKFVDAAEVREALHVGALGFTFSNGSVHRTLATDFLTKVAPVVETLLERYKILIYCGQLDLTAPCVQNAAARRRWRWSGRPRFLAAPRLPWMFNHSVAGYVKSGGNLTEALVRGAGHIAPLDKPGAVQDLVFRFIRDQRVATPPGYTTAATPEYQELQEDDGGSGNAGLVVSALLNVILVIAIAGMLMWFYKWKKQNDSLFIPLREDIFGVA